MKKQIGIISIIAFLLTGSYSVNAQLNLKDIETIFITDRVIWNYEKVRSFTWEIKIADSVELWHTKQISRAEFETEINTSKVDSLNSALQGIRKYGRDSLKKYFDEHKLILENDYKLYCDTVKAQFVKYVNSQEVINLSNALLDTTYTYKRFISEIQPADSLIQDLGIFMTSYYPLVGITIILNSGDSLIAYCDGQGELTIPWTLEHYSFESFNPAINKALYAILPKEMNINRKRLIRGLSKNEKP